MEKLENRKNWPWPIQYGDKALHKAGSRAAAAVCMKASLLLRLASGKNQFSYQLSTRNSQSSKLFRLRVRKALALA